MADLVSQPILFNPSEQNGYMVFQVDINASNAITSSVDNYLESSSTQNAFVKREDAPHDNILEPSALPPLAKRPCPPAGNRGPKHEQGEKRLKSGRVEFDFDVLHDQKR